MGMAKIKVKQSKTKQTKPFYKKYCNSVFQNTLKYLVQMIFLIMADKISSNSYFRNTEKLLYAAPKIY